MGWRQSVVAAEVDVVVAVVVLQQPADQEPRLLLSESQDVNLIVANLIRL